MLASTSGRESGGPRGRRAVKGLGGADSINVGMDSTPGTKVVPHSDLGRGHTRC